MNLRKLRRGLSIGLVSLAALAGGAHAADKEAVNDVMCNEHVLHAQLDFAIEEEYRGRSPYDVEDVLKKMKKCDISIDKYERIFEQEIIDELRGTTIVETDFSLVYDNLEILKDVFETDTGEYTNLLTQTGFDSDIFSQVEITYLLHKYSTPPEQLCDFFFTSALESNMILEATKELSRHNGTKPGWVELLRDKVFEVFQPHFTIDFRDVIPTIKYLVETTDDTLEEYVLEVRDLARQQANDENYLLAHNTTDVFAHLGAGWEPLDGSERVEGIPNIRDMYAETTFGIELLKLEKGQIGDIRTLLSYAKNAGYDTAYFKYDIQHSIDSALDAEDPDYFFIHRAVHDYTRHYGDDFDDIWEQIHDDLDTMIRTGDYERAFEILRYEMSGPDWEIHEGIAYDKHPGFDRLDLWSSIYDQAVRAEDEGMISALKHEIRNLERRVDN